MSAAVHVLDQKDQNSGGTRAQDPHCCGYGVPGLEELDGICSKHSSNNKGPAYICLLPPCELVDFHDIVPLAFLYRQRPKIHGKSRPHKLKTRQKHTASIPNSWAETQQNNSDWPHVRAVKCNAGNPVQKSRRKLPAGARCHQQEKRFAIQAS
jgi:hypothetical protein